jgi:hypothetical protein
MDREILERTANDLSENLHNIGENPYAIDSDADLLVNGPVVCLGIVSYSMKRNFIGSECPEISRPSA